MNSNIQQKKRKATDSQLEQLAKMLKYFGPSRNGLKDILNSDCWLHIFMFLPMEDLYSISQLDVEDKPFFTTLIKSSSIGGRLLTLDMSLYNLNMENILTTFGKSLKKLRIEVKHSFWFREAIQKIIKYCSPGRLTMLQIDLSDCGPIAQDYFQMQELIPFIRDVKHLQITYNKNAPNEYGTLCSFFINEAKDLKTIKLKNINWGDTKFSQQILIRETQLTELYLINSGMFDSDFRLIEKLPHLRVFKCKSDSMSGTVLSGIGEALAKYCPNLDTYADISCADDENTIRYSFLQKMRCLKEATISSTSTNGAAVLIIPEILDEAISLRKMVISLGYNDMVILSKNDTETSLTTVEFYFDDFNSNIENCATFLRNLSSSMKYIRHVSIDGMDFVCNVPEILKHVPNLEELSIYKNQFVKLPVEARKIKSAIEKMVKGRWLKTVHIIANQELEREFKVLKNIDEIITITANPQLCSRGIEVLL